MNIKKIEGGLEEGVLSFSSIIFQLFSEYFQICYLGEKFSSIYPLHNKVEKRVIGCTLLDTITHKKGVNNDFIVTETMKKIN